MDLRRNVPMPQILKAGAVRLGLRPRDSNLREVGARFGPCYNLSFRDHFFHEARVP
jgi:hypothetical protein